MKIVCSDGHKTHAPAHEFMSGHLVKSSDTPQRQSQIRQKLAQWDDADFVSPHSYAKEDLYIVHPADYIHFLENIYDDWKYAGHAGDVFPNAIVTDQRKHNRPHEIEGLVGYYSTSAETSIVRGTWEAARESAHIALTASDLVTGAGEKAVFALCRPPGHHAFARRYGGYCYLNNIALCVQRAIKNGKKKVAVLDIDFHHGNGTQDIFYERDDVLFCSIHGDPVWAYPYYTGYNSEIGRGPGQGFNVNRALGKESSVADWKKAFEELLEAITAFCPDMLTISLGVDAHIDDPQSFFKLSATDYSWAAARISELGVPCAIIMEGGYNTETIGACTLAFLQGISMT